MLTKLCRTDIHNTQTGRFTLVLCVCVQEEEEERARENGEGGKTI